MFKILLAITAVIFLWFGLSAGVDLWAYLRLQQSAPAKITKVKVIEISSSAYALKVHYLFEHGKGKTTLSKPYYWNKYSAEKAAKEMSHKVSSVWYSPSKPSYNSLERAFPLKKVTYFFTTLAVFFYFYFRSKSFPTESERALDKA